MSGRERGFTMIEMMVVLLIIAVLLGVSIYSIRSARSSGGRIQAVATARAYEQAIDRFAATHGGQVPLANGTDWPPAQAADGPVANINGTKKRYMRATPEAVQDGKVLVGVGSAPSAPKGIATVTYVPDGTGYRLEVSSADFEPCAVYGHGAAPGGSKPRAC